VEINGIWVNIPNPAKTDRGKTPTPPATMAFRCSTRPHGRIGVVVCFDRHYPESIRSTVGAITEYSEEAASTTLRHLLSTVRQAELPEKKQPARSSGLCRPLCSLRLQIAVNCDKVSL